MFMLEKYIFLLYHVFSGCLAKPSRGCRSSFSLSRESRELARERFLPRGSPASLPESIFSLAGVPRGCQEAFSGSQAPCETAKRYFLARKPLARLPRSFFSLVSHLRGCPRSFFSLASPLRGCREAFSRSQAPCEVVRTQAEGVRCLFGLTCSYYLTQLMLFTIYPESKRIKTEPPRASQSMSRRHIRIF